MAEGERKRKRVSKNKKKNWRKHVNIDDVEEFQEDERLQERTGGPVRDKPNEQLFFVDKSTTDEPVAKKRRQDKPLKCHANLFLDPSIKPVYIKRNVRNENNLKKKSERVVAKLLSGAKTKKEQTAAEHQRAARIQRRSRRVIKRELPCASYDLWETSEVNGQDEELEEHFMKVTKKSRVKPTPKFHERPSGLPSVEAPHPGTSYNPSFEDHQELLHKACEVEVQKIKEENRIQRALDEMFPSRADAPNQESWLKEMSSGLFEDGVRDKNLPTSEVEDLDIISFNPPVRRDKKKTEQQKRKDKERKKEEIKKSKEKQGRMRDNEYFRLKAIKKEVKQQEEKIAQQAKKRAEAKEKSKTQPKRLGKLKFEEAEVDLKLSDELEGSLRLLKPEGHILEDRFKSFQKRSIIEPRQRTNIRRRYKPKFFEKKGHKEIKA